MSFLTTTAVPAMAGEDDNPFWEQYLTELYENSDEAAASMEEAYEYLQTLTQQPLDINTVEIEELKLIPGLDLNVISDIIQHRERYGSFRNVGELTLIPSIDYNLRQYLTSFLCVKDRKPSPWYSREGLAADLHNTRHKITATASFPTYYRAGDRGATASGNTSNKYSNAFLGDPTQHSLRYSMTMGEGIALNLTGGKSAGEPFFGDGNSMGYDAYAYNIVVKDLGIFHRIILGTFRAQFGMGLTMNNNMSFGKQSMLASATRLVNVFSPHNSTSDSKHLQGIASTIDIGDIRVSAFLSQRYIDATLNKDGSIATVITSGYHRTANEMKKKNNASQFTGGAHAEYETSMKNGIHVSAGASFVFTSFNRPLNPTYSSTDSIPDSRMYRLFHPHGYSFWNSSINYSISYNDFSLCGETATGDHGSIATINTLSWSINRLSFCAVQRYYSAYYYSHYASSFSSGSSVQNESGLYLSARYPISSKVKVEGYGDVAYYPWQKYLTSQPSYSWEGCLSASYTPNSRWDFSIRYIAKGRQRDNTAINGSKALFWRTDHHARIIISRNADRWNSRSQLEMCHMNYAKSTRGIIFSQSVGYNTSNSISLYAMGAYFHTGSYDSRLYTYERGMQYSFGYNAYYGRGMRWAFVGKTKISRLLTATVKAGYTHYFNRSSIGSAEREIFSNHQTDIDVQLQVKL